MRKPDLPFPSFTTMSYELQKDTLRLPCYRESLLQRFHPYPQTQRKASLMQTVDRRYTGECPYSEDPVRPLGDVHPSNESGKCDDTLGLDRAITSVTSDETPGIQRRRSLTTLIIDLALAMRGGFRDLKKRRSLAKVDPHN